MSSHTSLPDSFSRRQQVNLQEDFIRIRPFPIAIDGFRGEINIRHPRMETQDEQLGERAEYQTQQFMGTHRSQTQTPSLQRAQEQQDESNDYVQTQTQGHPIGMDQSQKEATKAGKPKLHSQLSSGAQGQQQDTASSFAQASTEYQPAHQDDHSNEGGVDSGVEEYQPEYRRTNSAPNFERLGIVEQREGKQNQAYNRDLHCLDRHELISLIETLREQHGHDQLQLEKKGRDIKTLERLVSDQAGDIVKLNTKSEHRHMHASYGELDRPQVNELPTPANSMALRYQYENKGQAAYEVMMMKDAIRIQCDQALDFQVEAAELKLQKKWLRVDREKLRCTCQKLETEAQVMKIAHKKEMDAKDNMIGLLQWQVKGEADTSSESGASSFELVNQDTPNSERGESITANPTILDIGNDKVEDSIAEEEGEYDDELEDHDLFYDVMLR
ncbi:hypothetical protein N431DRAFT_440906 [Stipitochalara longipes BDJ]|nr:hypothetical protein N431DRAFT_440906 [Stipitochalara longipes BDJ]